MSTDAGVKAEFDALTFDDVPCGGIGVSWLKRDCDRPAVLRSLGHGCNEDSRRLFKCVQCWQDWYIGHSRLLAERGFISCGQCRRRFGSVAAFSDYRPF